MPGPSARPPKGVPVKVWRIANAIRRQNPRTSDAKAYRIAWATYHHTIDRHRGRRMGRKLTRRTGRARARRR
jgi:hypothetical protein